MKLIVKYKKFVAAFLLIVFSAEIFVPNIAYALTSGPVQPETRGFEPIGNSDMVDLFSGDFSYNIPLMDVGGYPVNMSYQSGASMDDEASWVGYGWNLNVGTVNRQLRGLPDDFNGSDKMKREQSMKDHKTWGGKVSTTLDFLGIPKSSGKVKSKKKKFDFSLTLSAGIKVDNYNGIGVDLGFNAGLNLTEFVSTEKTVGDKKIVEDTAVKGANASVNVTLSSTGGAGISGSFHLLKKDKDTKDKLIAGSPFGFNFNTRSGLQSLTFKSYKNPFVFGDRGAVRHLKTGGTGTSSISFADESISPTIEIPTRNNTYTLTLHAGPQILPAYLGLGISGFYSKQTIPNKIREMSAYGYLNEEKGKDNAQALMDFNREKDIPYSSQVSFLPLPVHTYDLFMATSQDVAGQYRAYRGSSSVLFDHQVSSANNDFNLGLEVGAPIFDLGADIYAQTIISKIKKWTDRNAFLANGDYKLASATTPLFEPVYFKRVGEPTPVDKDYAAKYFNNSAIAVSVPAGIDNGILGAKTENKFTTKSNRSGTTISGALQKNKRDVRNTTFNYLTAKEAVNHALDKAIKDYHPDSVVIGNCTPGGIRTSISRTSDYRKGHHISEITVTGDDGKRKIGRASC